MSDFKVGAVSWFDLTVEDATKVRDFYRDVVGWESTDHDMGGYDDYCMNRPGDGTTVAGICHARGTNVTVAPTARARYTAFFSTGAHRR